MTDQTATVEHADETADYDLGDAMFRVARDTAEDGRVNAEITNVDAADSLNGEPYLEVTYRLPSMRTVTETMPYPETDTADYKFVRVCERAGYSLASVEQVEGAEIEAEQVEGDWQLYAPREPTLREHLSSRFQTLLTGGLTVFVFLTFPVSSAVGAWIGIYDSDASITSDDIMTWILASCIWFLIVFLIWNLFAPAAGAVSGGAEVPI